MTGKITTLRVLNRCSRGFALLGAIAISGCLHTASIGVLTPATTIVAAQGRVAIVGVANDESGVLTAQLNDRLGEFAEWTVVEASEIVPIQQVSTNAAASVETVIRHARDADVELLISAKVKEMAVVAQPSWQLFANESKATMTVQLAAISPLDTDARETRTITTTMSIPAGTTGVSADVRRKLTAAAIDEFLRDFQPNTASIQLDLAKGLLTDRGSRMVRIGNREAHKGHWLLASEYYRRALEANPQNDAALYNLAIAAMTERQFTKAEDLVLSALQLRADPMYIEGLDRIKQLAQTDEQVRYQTGESL